MIRPPLCSLVNTISENIESLFGNVVYNTTTTRIFTTVFLPIHIFTTLKQRY